MAKRHERHALPVDEDGLAPASPEHGTRRSSAGSRRGSPRPGRPSTTRSTSAPRPRRKGSLHHGDPPGARPGARRSRYGHQGGSSTTSRQPPASMRRRPPRGRRRRWARLAPGSRWWSRGPDHVPASLAHDLAVAPGGARGLDPHVAGRRPADDDTLAEPEVDEPGPVHVLHDQLRHGAPPDAYCRPDHDAVSSTIPACLPCGRSSGSTSSGSPLGCSRTPRGFAPSRRRGSTRALAGVLPGRHLHGPGLGAHGPGRGGARHRRQRLVPPRHGGGPLLAAVERPPRRRSPSTRPRGGAPRSEALAFTCGQALLVVQPGGERRLVGHAQAPLRVRRLEGLRRPRPSRRSRAEPRAGARAVPVPVVLGTGGRASLHRLDRRGGGAGPRDATARPSPSSTSPTWTTTSSASGPDHARRAARVAEVDDAAGVLLDAAAEIGAEVVAFSEYGLQPVRSRRASEPGPPARRGSWPCATVPSARCSTPSRAAALAVCDHQVAHVYVRDPSRAERARALLSSLDGVAAVLEGEALEAHGLAHPRAGDLVLLAEPDAWFAYPYWLDDDRAPDFARTVDIHRKPGYDPARALPRPAARRSRSSGSRGACSRRSSASATGWTWCRSTRRS